jgi:hypothetical protein
LKLTFLPNPGPWLPVSAQAAVCDPNCALVPRQVALVTFAVTVAFITLPGGDEVLVTPSIVALLVVIAPKAALGQAAAATTSSARPTLTRCPRTDENRVRPRSRAKGTALASDGGDASTLISLNWPACDLRGVTEGVRVDWQWSPTSQRIG